MPNSYIGAVQIDSGDPIKIGSTLFGVCDTAAATAAKVVTLSSFDQLVPGITIQVKFTNGNTANTSLTMQVNTTDELPITGDCLCEADQVIAFTFENLTTTRYWRSHHNIKGAMPITGGEFTGPVTLSTDIGSSSPSLSVATKNYVDSRTAGLSGLTGAMHFKGRVSTLPTATDSATFDAYDAGDVILVQGTNKEYVYNKGSNAANSAWIELGDEGSYVLQSSQTTDTIDEVIAWNDGTLPTLTVTDTSVSRVTVTSGEAASLTPQQISVPNVTQAGTATTASVSAGILSISTGQDTTLGTNLTFNAVGSWTTNTPTAVTSAPVTVGSASNWDAGAKPTLTQYPTTVVVPAPVNTP